MDQAKRGAKGRNVLLIPNMTKKINKIPYVFFSNVRGYLPPIYPLKPDYSRLKT